MQERTLEGIKVVECAEMVAGPYCGKLLSDLGAEVTKVEAPCGDPARRRGPFRGDLPDAEGSALFLYLNTNKLGVTLNLENKKGRRLLGELVRETDILIADWPPSESERLSLSYEIFSAANPRLVITSITPFGQTGLHRDYRAYPLNTFHGGGEGYLLPGGKQNLEREPVRGAGFLTEYDSGLCAAVATLGALFCARLTGRGQQIDVSKQEAAMALSRVDIARYRWDGVVESRAIRGARPGNSIRCLDGYVQIHCPGDHQWRALLEAMGNPGWAADPKYGDRASRVKHVEEINARIEEWSTELTTREVARRVQAKGCPAAPYNTIADLLQDEHLKYRGFFAQAEHPRAGKLTYPTVPYRLSLTPPDCPRPAPLLGQHNQLILGARLGHSTRQLLQLSQAGVI
ncbi:MAG: CoA transferase [Chloroflexi bacterium]|nr:CoA transferase [Chloroflexota bacterium]